MKACLAFGLLSCILATAFATKSLGSVASEIVNPDPNPPPTEAYKGESGKHFEGDIAGEVAGSTASNRNALTDTTKRWPNGNVCYYFDPSASAAADVVAAVKAAIADYEKYTCIRFHTQTAADKNCIKIFREDGCYSYLGMTGGIQPLSLGQGCQWKGTAIHEFMHALGFTHEQSREDRDDFITLHPENMEQGADSQFRKADVGHSAFGFPYDTNSVMHYGRDFFSKNGLDTMTPKNPAVQTLGQREGFTKQDIAKIRKVYNCDNVAVGAGGTLIKTENVTPIKTQIVAAMNKLRTSQGSTSSLTWDDTLAKQAETLSKNCVDKEISTEGGKKTLRFTHSSSYTDLLKVFQPAYDEYVYAFKTQAERPDRMCCSAEGYCQRPCFERFTLVVDNNVKKVGCGASKCKGMKESKKDAKADYYHGVCVFDQTGGSSPPSGGTGSGTGGSGAGPRPTGTGGACADGTNIDCAGTISSNAGIDKKQMCDLLKGWGYNCNKTCGLC